MLEHIGSDTDASLRQLAAMNEDEFRQAVAAMTQAQTQLVLSSLSQAEARDRTPLIQRFKDERVVATALSMQGGLTWSGMSCSHPLNAQPRECPPPNAFLRWVLKDESEPTAPGGEMNCWEAVIYSAFKAGVVTKKWIVEALYGRLPPAKPDDIPQFGSPYMRSFEDLIGASRAKPMTAEHQTQRGNLVFFTEEHQPLSHVALSLGSRTSTGEHEIMSLWVTGDGPDRNKFQHTTIEKVCEYGKIPLSAVHFAPSAWGEI